MWTKIKYSHTSEFPQPGNLAKHFIHELLERKIDGSWVHFEKEKKEFLKKSLWLEIGYREGNQLEVNVGKNKIEIKEWEKIGIGLWKIDNPQTESIASWVEEFFKDSSEESDQKIKGWIDGL